MKYNREDDDDNSSLKSKNEDNNNESDSDSYPTDLRKVVNQINEKEEKKNNYLNRKRNLEEGEENQPERYDVNSGKLLTDFVPDEKELYDILNNKENIYISIITEEEMNKKIKNKNAFNYNKFKKKNKISENVLSFEDLLNYLDEITEKGQKQNKIEDKEIQKYNKEQIEYQKTNDKEDDDFYDINKIDFDKYNYYEHTQNEILNKKMESGKILKNNFVKANKKTLDNNERNELKNIFDILDL